MAVAILIMIGVGGYTRLSRSGLSMVEWKPVTGWLPPLNHEKWQESFDKYRQSPEYQKVNRGMSLDAYKDIYLVEYGHRLLGRILGLIFFVPFVIFSLLGKLRGKAFWGYLLLGILGGLQGLIGWLMVKSGLVDRPEVSAYRLCAHLAMGGFLYWLCLERFARERWPRQVPTGVLANLCLCVTALQICSGAFVSGTQAGHVFPSLWSSLQMFSLSIFWDDSLALLNLFENIATILTHHLVLGTGLTALITIYALKLKQRSPKASSWTFAALGLQIALGLLTLFYYSPERPVILSLLHQLGAFILLSVITLSRFSENNTTV